MRLLTVVPELECFLNRFRNLMSRIRFRHFCRYIIGLAASDRKSIRRIAVSCQERVDQSNLNRFIHSDAIDDNSIHARVMDMVWRNIAKRRSSGRLKVFLIIDDSLLQKFGTRMEGAGYIFSTKEHRSILCHDVVTSFMVAGGMGYPVDVRLYVKEDVCGTMGVPFKTRIELAGELIKSFRVPPCADVTVLFDTWYLSKEIVDAVHARGWHYISESKPNRWAWYEGNRVKLDGMRLLVRHLFSDHDIEGNLYSCFQKDVHVESLGDISLVMKERLFQKGPDVMHFLVSDTMGIGADEVVLEYDRRHRIEEFYRDGKQSLGLGEYMVRDSRASNRHWRWVFLAYTLLVLVRDAEGLVEKTIGQMCDWIREKCAEVLVSRACTMARRSPETKQIVQALL